MEKIVLTDLISQYPDVQDILDILLYNRNQNMAGQIERFSEFRANVFCRRGRGAFDRREGHHRIVAAKGIYR